MIAGLQQRIFGVWIGAQGGFSRGAKSMFDPAPIRPVLAIRVREEMAREIRAEAKKRKLKTSEEIRRRLELARHKKMLEAA
jgi:hypothetical protein